MTQNKDQELKIYELTNKTTAHRHLSVSDNAQDACKQAGWLIGDCFVKELHPLVKPTESGHSKPMVRIPCQVCPYQYGECTKPAEAECPVRNNAPNLNEWLIQVAAAHLCEYTGEQLTQNDYIQQRKWASYKQMIKELGHRH